LLDELRSPGRRLARRPRTATMRSRRKKPLPNQKPMKKWSKWDRKEKEKAVEKKRKRKVSVDNDEPEAVETPSSQEGEDHEGFQELKEAGPQGRQQR
jgi:hypothetical protein